MITYLHYHLLKLHKKEILLMASNNMEYYRKLDQDPIDIFVQDIKNIHSDNVNHHSVDEDTSVNVYVKV